MDAFGTIIIANVAAACRKRIGHIGYANGDETVSATQRCVGNSAAGAGGSW
ncbi:MAG: hypothetical protein WC058_06960 [Phycisphaeraceae bacterium]